MMTERKQLYKRAERAEQTLLKYVDKVAAQKREIESLKRIIERLRRG
jgi:hypothetical protein